MEKEIDALEVSTAYVTEARNLGLIHVTPCPEVFPGTRIFQFYLNTQGYILTSDDPFLVALLILLGKNYADEMGLGDHTALLNSCADPAILDRQPNPKGDNAVLWDYMIGGRDIVSLEDWLLKELNTRSKTLNQLAIRHRFIEFLAERHHKTLDFTEKLFWWIPR